MFRKTIIKLSEKSQPQVVKDFLSLPLNKGIKDAYQSNEDLLNEMKLPYDLRGEYTPRTPISPFRRKPMSVIYDQNNFQQFVMPSKRQYVHGFIDIEKLFGIKRWRNDSPFIKEYIRIDNEIFVYSIIATVVLILFSFERFERIENYKMQILLEDKANYTAKDLI
jgi:hypothetical protein